MLILDHFSFVPCENIICQKNTRNPLMYALTKLKYIIT